MFLFEYFIEYFFSRYILFSKRHLLQNYGRIVVFSGDLVSLLLALGMKKKALCYDIHYSMLDFPWTYKNSSINNILIKYFSYRLINKVDSVDCISKPMYTRIKNHLKNNLVFQNSVFLDLINYEENQRYSENLRNGVFKIGFAGNLRFKEGIFFAANYFNSLDHNVEFHCFSSSLVEMDVDSIRNRGFFENELELVLELRKLNCAFIPLSFNVNDISLVETSFPSKTSTYLKAKLPIIAHVPQNSAIYKFIKMYNLGLILDECAPQNVLSELKKIEINWSRNYNKFLSDTKETISPLFNHFQYENNK
jgi:hypothetical protein